MKKYHLKSPSHFTPSIDYAEHLNPEQLAAVTSRDGAALVIAGAGSGKTRVVTYRVAYLIEKGVDPSRIMLLTFTNKAAREMRGRIEELLKIQTSGMWFGTFHGIAHRLLRTHWREADLPETFQILDSDDQLRIVKRILKEMRLDDSQFVR